MEKLNLSYLLGYDQINSITACYTEDLGCAALFTITFPLAFSAVSIACAVAVS